jgi:methylase of polypeptide subunit release factors
LPQAIIPFSDIQASGIDAVYLLRTDKAIEELLSSIPPHTRSFSVNDAATVKYPSGDEFISKHYRKLSLKYAKDVVPPLHFSNYAFIQYMKTQIGPQTKVADMFTGPGTIGLSLAKECGLSEVTLIDINKEAVNMARENLKTNFNGPFRGHIYESDIFDNIPNDMCFDIILGNPPHALDENGENSYLSNMVYVQAHDRDMRIHRKFFEQASQRLNYGGRIFLLESSAEGGVSIEHIRELIRGFGKYKIDLYQKIPASGYYIVGLSLKEKRS